jgi:hypothetical protein
MDQHSLENHSLENHSLENQSLPSPEGMQGEYGPPGERHLPSRATPYAAGLAVAAARKCGWFRRTALA